ncbi:MAG: SHOCT domain-containing protein [Oscillospiraceae bacterium]|nr:SHOCT domain-containing protein [Oscillospiraceae bacterium]
MANQFYSGDSLKEQTPQKIITFAKKTQVLSADDLVEAILGRTILWGIGSFLAVTDKDIIYFNNDSGLPKTLRYAFSNIESVGKVTRVFDVIVLTVNALGAVPIDIMADNSYTNSMYEFILDKVEKCKKQKYSANVQAGANTQSTDVADQIKKLFELKEMGAITEDEFAQKKKQLLTL